MRFDDNENPAGTPRKPGRKFGFDKNSAPRKKFDDRFENGSSERQTGTGRHEGGFNRPAASSDEQTARLICF